MPSTKTIISLALIVGAALLVHPAFHPIVAVGSIGASAVVSVLATELISHVGSVTFASSQETETETVEKQSLAASFARMEDALGDEQSHSEMSVSELQEAYVSGDIGEVEFEKRLADRLDDDLRVDADGVVRDDDSADSLFDTETFREEKSRVSETTDRDPRRY